MLISYTMENAYSFKESTTLDMQATAIKAHSYSLLESGQHKLLPIAAIYGANASGKTNLIRCLDNMRSCILGKRSQPIPYAMLDTRGILPFYKSELRFLIQLDDNWIECKYTIHASAYSAKDGYSREELMCVTPGKKSLSLVYKREWDEKNNKWVLKTGSSALVKATVNEIKYVHDMEDGREVLLLTVLGKRARFAVFEQIFLWIERNVIYIEPYTNKSVLQLINEDDYLVTFINNKKTYPELLSLVQSINPLIKEISLMDATEFGQDGNNKKLYRLQYNYDINGIAKENRNIVISLFESKGIWTAMRLYPKVFDTLHNGGLLIVDELENSLHPLLMADIINMFTSPETNPGKGQLIFTTHNALLMDKKYFRQDEIIFVNKDSSGCSSLYRLSDIDGIRSDLDFCKNYIYGAFGAIPDLSIDSEDMPI